MSLKDKKIDFEQAQNKFRATDLFYFEEDVKKAVLDLEQDIKNDDFSVDKIRILLNKIEHHLGNYRKK